MNISLSLSPPLNCGTIYTHQSVSFTDVTSLLLPSLTASHFLYVSLRIGLGLRVLLPLLPLLSLPLVLALFALLDIAFFSSLGERRPSFGSYGFTSGGRSRVCPFGRHTGLLASSSFLAAPAIDVNGHVLPPKCQWSPSRVQTTAAAFRPTDTLA